MYKPYNYKVLAVFYACALELDSRVQDAMKRENTGCRDQRELVVALRAAGK